MTTAFKSPWRKRHRSALQCAFIAAVAAISAVASFATQAATLLVESVRRR